MRRTTAEPSSRTNKKSQNGQNLNIDNGFPGKIPGGPTEDDDCCDVVFTVTVAVTAELPFRVTACGDHEQVVAWGKLTHDSNTTWLKPFDGAMVTV